MHFAHEGNGEESYQTFPLHLSKEALDSYDLLHCSLWAPLYTMNITGNIYHRILATKGQPALHKMQVFHSINWLPEPSPHWALPGRSVYSSVGKYSVCSISSSFTQTYFWTTIICIILAKWKENIPYVTLGSGPLHYSLCSVSPEFPPLLTKLWQSSADIM